MFREKCNKRNRLFMRSKSVPQTEKEDGVYYFKIANHKVGFYSSWVFFKCIKNPKYYVILSWTETMVWFSNSWENEFCSRSC